MDTGMTPPSLELPAAGQLWVGMLVYSSKDVGDGRSVYGLAGYYAVCI
jgi:hypothetical protein